MDLNIKVLSKPGTGDIVQEYISFCHTLDEQIKLHGQTKKAVEETIRLCQKRNILFQYLEERLKEVGNIMSILFSQEEVTERYGYERFLEGQKAGISQGITQGISQGFNQASENIALNLLRDKMEFEKVAKCTQLPLTRIKELSKTL